MKLNKTYFYVYRFLRGGGDPPILENKDEHKFYLYVCSNPLLPIMNTS